MRKRGGRSKCKIKIKIKMDPSLTSCAVEGRWDDVMIWDDAANWKDVGTVGSPEKKQQPYSFSSPPSSLPSSLPCTYPPPGPTRTLRAGTTVEMACL